VTQEPASRRRLNQGGGRENEPDPASYAKELDDRADSDARFVELSRRKGPFWECLTACPPPLRYVSSLLRSLRARSDRHAFYRFLLDE